MDGSVGGTINYVYITIATLGNALDFGDLTIERSMLFWMCIITNSMEFLVGGLWNSTEYKYN